jgi:conjugative transposon TraN protein
MKKYSITFFLLFPLILFAENQIKVCENKVIHLISEDKITYLQLGNQDVLLAEVVPEHPNLARIKALGKFEGESSITLAAGGQLYTLILTYGKDPENAYLLQEFESREADLYLGQLMSRKVLDENCRRILEHQKRIGKRHKMIKDGISLDLRNIYLSNDVLFFEVGITNHTDMGYDVESFQWWIADKRQFRASNAQEYQLQPRFQYYSIGYVPAQSTVREIFVLPKLNVPDQRVLRIEMLEKALGNTGRKLSLELENRDLLKAENL